jgi:hypothetical protein
VPWSCCQPSYLKRASVCLRLENSHVSAANNNRSKLCGSLIFFTGGDLRIILFADAVRGPAPDFLPGYDDLYIHQHILRHQLHGRIFDAFAAGKKSIFIFRLLKVRLFCGNH